MFFNFLLFLSLFYSGVGYVCVSGSEDGGDVHVQADVEHRYAKICYTNIHVYAVLLKSCGYGLLHAYMLYLRMLNIILVCMGFVYILFIVKLSTIRYKHL